MKNFGLYFALIICAINITVDCDKLIRIPLHLAPPIKPHPCQELCSVSAYTNYFANVAVGTPPQYFTILIDSRSDYSWVMSKRCNLTDHRYHVTYDSDASTTYASRNERFEDVYDFGRVEGTLFTDTIDIGGNFISGEVFGEVELVSDRVESHFNIQTKLDGVFGLNFGLPMVESFFKKLVEKNLIEQSEFSVYLNRTGGELVLGGIDNRTSNLTYVPIVKNIFGWIVEADSISVNGKELFSTTLAMFDTTATGILGPEEKIQQINQILKATKDANGDYVVNCQQVEKLPNISFIFQGSEFPLEWKDYIFVVSQNDEVKCVSLFRNTKIDNRWVLGNVFMTKYITVFDFENKKVGFGAAKSSELVPAAFSIIILLEIIIILC